MKLLYVMSHPSDRLQDERAGHVVRPRQLLAGLRAAGVDVRVAEAAGTPGAQAAARSYWRVRDALPRAAALTARDAVRVLQNERFARRARVAARSDPPDLLLETQVGFSTAGAALARALGVPLVLDDVSPVQEDEQVYDVRLRALARRRRAASLSRAALVVVTSAASRDAVVAEGVAAPRVAVVANGVPDDALDDDGRRAERRAELGLRPDDVVVAYAGSFQSFHRVDLLVEALARPEVPARVRLLLVGDGDERGAVEELASRRGVGERVLVTGRVASGRVAPLLRAADAGVLPATAEWTNPMKLYDYLAAGLPVLAPRQRAVREVLGDTPAALFDPGSAAGLASALQQVSAGAEGALHRAGLAQASRAAARGHTWSARAAQLLAEVRSRTGLDHGA